MLRLAAIAAIGVLSAVGAAHELMAQTSAPASTVQTTQADVLRGPLASDAAPADMATGDAQVVKSADGHFWAEGAVDGTEVHFLVDTGATTVALTGDDAKRLGIDTQSLVFNVPVRTANGSTDAARVHLANISVGGARVEDVDAMVVPTGLTTSLLGMSYLGRLSGFEATPRALILKP